MAVTETGINPVAPEAEEYREFQASYRAIPRLKSAHGVRLVGPDGQEVALPPTLLRILLSAAAAISRGDAVSVVPVHRELTTQQAAEILNVSRQYLVRLLDEGQIPYSKVGAHRRVRFDDLMAYKCEREARRREKLRELTQASQEEGLY